MFIRQFFFTSHQTKYKVLFHNQIISYQSNLSYLFKKPCLEEKKLDPMLDKNFVKIIDDGSQSKQNPHVYLFLSKQPVGIFENCLR